MFKVTLPPQLQELQAKLHNTETTDVNQDAQNQPFVSTVSTCSTFVHHVGRLGRNIFPLTMTIPPEQASKPIVLPRGQWQREEDGSITVTFNDAEELRDCLDATKAIREG